MQYFEITACPGLIESKDNSEEVRCNAMAEIVDRAILESTDGPIEHLRTRCLAEVSHSFFLPASMAAQEAGPTNSAA